jgi:hydrogenase nickel incorporation protein HypB
MCVVCGCGDDTSHHDHDHHSHGPAHEHRHVHVDAATGDRHYGRGPAHVTVPGMTAARTLRLETDVLGENARIAAQNRAHFEAHGVLALNLVSSPGSGKTSLLCKTIAALRDMSPDLALAVIEGDQQTSHDAERIRALGTPAIQINTGKGCHLDAPMVAEAFASLPLHDHHSARDHGGVLFIENVGNLVCPALWDLGERAKVAILSVTEGADKPLKYPDMFAAARLMLLNKIDLLPYVEFDVAACVAYARRVNPSIEVIELSATRGDGVDTFVRWLQREAAALSHRPV